MIDLFTMIWRFANPFPSLPSAGREDTYSLQKVVAYIAYIHAYQDLHYLLPVYLAVLLLVGVIMMVMVIGNVNVNVIYDLLYECEKLLSLRVARAQACAAGGMEGGEVIK